MNGINDKHHAAGSEQPSYAKDKVTVINMRFCPFAQRTLLILIKKNIPFENVNVNLKSKPDWFLAANPLGKVPTIILPQEGQGQRESLYESLVTCDYLDEVYHPDQPLTAKDPKRRAEDRMILTHFDKFLGFFYSFYRLSPDELTSEHMTNYLSSLDVIENELCKRKSTYFSGNEVGMLDYMLWPWFERYPAIAEIFPNAEWPKDRFPKLFGWMSMMEKDSAVKAYALSKEIHLEYIKSSRAGTPNYNMLSK